MAARLGRTRVLIERFLSHDYMPAAVGLLILAAVAALVSAQTPGGPAVSQRARALHSGALVFDGHIHAVDREFLPLGGLCRWKPGGQSGLPRPKEGGLGALFFSFF